MAGSVCLAGQEEEGKMRKLKNPIPDRGYICGNCARVLGGKWPKGHVATFHEGKCLICRDTKALASVGDWNWPDKKHRGMRD